MVEGFYVGVLSVVVGEKLVGGDDARFQEGLGEFDGGASAEDVSDGPVDVGSGEVAEGIGYWGCGLFVHDFVAEVKEIGDRGVEGG